MEAIVIYLLKSAGILAIFFFSFQLFLKKETFFKVNRHYLLAGILASLLLPLVIFTQYVFVEPVTKTLDPLWLLTDIPVNYNLIEETEPFNWLQFATYIYLIGVVFFTIRFAIQLTSLVRLFYTNTIKKRDGFNIVEINSNMSPFSFFNFIVYNPRRYNKKDLDIIINHEKAHSNQFHSLDILLSQLFVILQWFNPIAWFYKKSIQQNLEFMADQFAVSKVDSAQQYQHTLLKASLKPQFASITNNFYNSLIKKRIIMLNQSKSNIKNAWKYFVVLPALALFLMSFNVETVEVVKEPRELTTTSDLSVILDNEFFSKSDATNNSVPSKVIEKKLTIPQVDIAQKIIEVKIDKNTTDQELKEISESLKKDGIEFNYKNLKRNDKNEIIGINVTYKDSDGNTGNYALSSDNPISAIRFFKEEDGRIGFKSENVNKEKYREYVVQRELSDEKRDQMRKEREHLKQERMMMIEKRKELSEDQRREMKEQIEKEYMQRKEEMKVRRKEMEIHMKEARKEHEKARKEHQEQRKIIIKERIKLNDSLKDKHGNIFFNEIEDHDENKLFFTGKSNTLFIVDGEESEEEIIELMSPENIAHVNVLKGEHAIKMYGKKGKDGVIVIKTKPHGENHFEYEFDHELTEPKYRVMVDPDMEFEWVSEFGNVEIQTIDKNTSNEDLKAMKSDFKSKGIDFTYGKVKRNEDGKITRIKVTLDDNDGDKTSATFNHSDKNIPHIILGKNRNNLFIKSN